MTSDNSRDQLLVRSRRVNTLLKTTIREICLVVNILYFYKKTPLVFDTWHLRRDESLPGTIV